MSVIQQGKYLIRSVQAADCNMSVPGVDLNNERIGCGGEREANQRDQMDAQ